MNFVKTLSLLLLVAGFVATPSLVFAQADDKSGLTLGVEVYESYYGPVISEILPKYAGNTKALRKGDIIKGIAANGKLIKTPNRKKLVEAKALMGPDVKGVMKIWRPKVGFMYPIISLTADSGTMTVQTGEQTAKSKQTYEAFDNSKDPEPKKPIPSEDGSSRGGEPGVFPDS